MIDSGNKVISEKKKYLSKQEKMNEKLQVKKSNLVREQKLVHKLLMEKNKSARREFFSKYVKNSEMLYALKMKSLISFVISVFMLVLSFTLMLVKIDSVFQSVFMLISLLFFSYSVIYIISFKSKYNKILYHTLEVNSELEDQISMLDYSINYNLKLFSELKKEIFNLEKYELMKRNVCL